MRISHLACVAFVLSLVALASAQERHDCVKAGDCQECGEECDRNVVAKYKCDMSKYPSIFDCIRNPGKACPGCWTPKMRNEARDCVHDVCGWPDPPHHEPE